MDPLALIAALFGVAVGAIGSYFLIRREWWRATGWLAIGGSGLLNLITEGSHSALEDLLKFAATVVLMVIFVVAVIVLRRGARSVADQAATRGL